MTYFRSLAIICIMIVITKAIAEIWELSDVATTKSDGTMTRMEQLDN